MNYTKKDIELIKQKAYDKGRIEGILITVLIFFIGALFIIFKSYL
jgi:hypothetical protein